MMSLICPDVPPDRDWRVRDRLTAADIDQLVESFMDGATTPELVNPLERHPRSVLAE
jgi:hypothetical protein